MAALTYQSQLTGNTACKHWPTSKISSIKINIK
jgi:hypothetical protein